MVKKLEAPPEIAKRFAPEPRPPLPPEEVVRRFGEPLPGSVDAPLWPSEVGSVFPRGEFESQPRSKPPQPPPTRHFKPQQVEDDTPVPRHKGARPDRTVAVDQADARTQRHAASPPTEMLTQAAWEDPQPTPREPTEAIPAPEALTTKMPSAENLAPAPEKFDRVGWGADRLEMIASSFDVDRLPTTALFIRGLVAGIRDTTADTFVEHLAKRLVQRMMMADHGLGGGLTEPQLTRLLIEIAGEVTAGVTASRQAELKIAKELGEKAARYRNLAEASRLKGDTEGTLQWTTRADTLTAEARRLKDGR